MLIVVKEPVFPIFITLYLSKVLSSLGIIVKTLQMQGWKWPLCEGNLYGQVTVEDWYLLIQDWDWLNSQPGCSPQPSVVSIIEEGQECPLSHSSRWSSKWRRLNTLQPLSHHMNAGPSIDTLRKPVRGRLHPSVDTEVKQWCHPPFGRLKMLVQLLWEGWKMIFGDVGPEPQIVSEAWFDNCVINWGDGGGMKLGMERNWCLQDPGGLNLWDFCWQSAVAQTFRTKGCQEVFYVHFPFSLFSVSLPEANQTFSVWPDQISSMGRMLIGAFR